MMRALWSAASGMNAQELNVDTIANNLANVNTNGYKKVRVEFQRLVPGMQCGYDAGPCS